jgi:hypothetical protein
VEVVKVVRAAAPAAAASVAAAPAAVAPVVAPAPVASSDADPASVAPHDQAPSGDAPDPVPASDFGVYRAVRLARFARAKLAEARPASLDAENLRVALEDGRERGVRLERIQAVAVALVADLGSRPVLLIDLLANWNEPEAEELRGVRLRSDRFDPRPLLACEGDAREAFGALVGRLLQASRGVPLPSAEAALGRPFARFAALADYQREVLEVGE